MTSVGSRDLTTYQSSPSRSQQDMDTIYVSYRVSPTRPGRLPYRVSIATRLSKAEVQNLYEQDETLAETLVRLLDCRYAAMDQHSSVDDIHDSVVIHPIETFKDSVKDLIGRSVRLQLVDDGMMDVVCPEGEKTRQSHDKYRLVELREIQGLQLKLFPKVPAQSSRRQGRRLMPSDS